MITGHQWWWEARYPNGAATASEIHIPAGRRLLARIESADVIHDFWVPQLARKMDAVPGRAGYIWLEADDPGTYAGHLLGVLRHAARRDALRVIAEPEADFSAWVTVRPRRPAADPAERLFRELKCADCHAISAEITHARIGPPLAHFASRDSWAAIFPTLRKSRSLDHQPAIDQARQPHAGLSRCPPTNLQALTTLSGDPPNEPA